jgi:hypothetical protein
MATNKSAVDSNKPADEMTDPEVAEFLTDPKHQKQRDFMRAIIRDTLAADAAAAKTKTVDVGGSFIDNFVDGLTGGFLSGGK